jgi:hypothetical protein
MKRFVILSIVLLGSIGASAQSVPEAAQYPAKVEQATARHVDLASNPKAETFKTDLNDSLQSGVNFAGHFVVAQWGCGSGCVQVAIIDGRNGHVYFPSQLQGVTPGSGELENSELLAFKPESTLLILSGIPSDKTDYGVWYYSWTGTEFKLILYVRKSGHA